MKSLTLLCLLMLGPDADAQDSAPPTLSADLRAEYLAGEKLLVQLRAQNDSAQPVTVPDLAVRHDLVRFELQKAGGVVDTRRSLVDDPTPRTWQIPPRGAREVLLELPSSSTLRPGEYKLAIHVELAESDQRILPPHTLRMATPDPVEADLSAGALASDRGSDLIPWVHKAQDGFDLYLFRASSGAPMRAQAQDYLARLPGKVDPLLTAARNTEASSRYVVWLHGARTIGFGEIQGHQLRSAQSVDVPWPAVELAARGATSPEGYLYQPLWIPAPSGSAGELRLLTATGRSTAYQRVARFKERPQHIRTLIDDGGAIHIVTSSAGSIDVYTIRAGTDPALAAKENLPVGGKRVLTGTPGQPVADLRFGLLKGADTYPGGLAMLVLQQTAPGQLTPKWMTLSGKPIRDGQPVPLPEGARLIDVLPDGSGDVGLLMRLSSGQLRYVEGGQYQQVSGVSGEMALDRDDDGAPYLRALGAPLTTLMLVPDTPLPTVPPVPVQ